MPLVERGGEHDVGAVSAQLRPDAPVNTPAFANASTPGSHGNRRIANARREPCAAAQFERVAEQAEAGHVGHRVHAFELREVRARAS